jgi:hypothetical protein
MTAKIRIVAAAGVVLGMLALGWALLQQRQGLTPLMSSSSARVRHPLPDGTVVLRAADAPAIEAPLIRQPRQAEVETGDILALPDNGGANNDRGRAELPFHVSRPGVYAAWVRARWDNACGNSVLLHVDGGKGFTAGEDAVFNAWHWIRAGRYTLAAGEHKIVLAGREDGIAVDEILFTPSASFVPAASARAAVPIPDLRRTADNFDRSPGHGLDPWQVTSGRWDIVFTLDPNRIPDQYALTGRPGTNGEAAVAVLQGDPWSGVRFAFSFSPNEPGEAGVLLEHGIAGHPAQAILFQIASNAATLRVEGPGGIRSCELGDRVRLGQWHRVVVERWAWLLRVSVDGHPVFTTLGPVPIPGAVACSVRSGAAVFDDVSVEEIPWQAEDGSRFTIPWTVAADARWDRVAPARGGGLAGKRGDILAGLDGLPVHAVLLDDHASATCRVAGREPAEVYRDGDVRLLETAGGADAGSAVALGAGPRAARIRRVAIAYGKPAPDLYVEGPYHFTSPVIDDPSDYLDFSPEEIQQTVDPVQADKLRRKPKTFRLVGRRLDGSAWVLDGGQWDVRDGLLAGSQPGAVQHWRDISVSLEMRGRVCLDAPASVAGLEFYAEDNRGIQVRLGPAAGGADAGGTNGVVLPVPADGVWHGVRVRIAGNRLTGAVDDREVADRRVARGVGGALRLATVAGTVRFDDVEFRVPRAGPGDYFYAFDRRETDWWREGGAWIDHGGISCSLASHWISLVAPEGRGVLWNKRAFGSDLLVALTVEENTEWFGWGQAHSHVHHPYDNLCLLLGPAADWDSGYRLEVNARGRTATVLYRAGKEVASVVQDARFPMRYMGGSQPYSPRRNRLALLREGSRVRALVNGVEVLAFDDPSPLPVSRVGVGGYNTHVNFSHVEIRELSGDNGSAPAR